MMRQQLNMPEMPAGYWSVIPAKYRSGILKCPSLRTAPFDELEIHYGMPAYNIGGGDWGTVEPRDYAHLYVPWATFLTTTPWGWP